MLERKNYILKRKSWGTYLLNQTWRKKTDTWWKVRTWKNRTSWQNRTRTYTHYPYFFLSNFSIFPFFIKHRRFIVVICFSFSIINSNLLKLRDFYDISISQHLLNSVYVGNTGESSVCFFPRLFSRLLLNF